MPPRVLLIATCAALSALAIGVILLRRARAQQQRFRHEERIADALGAVLLAARAHLPEAVSEIQRREAMAAIEVTASDAVVAIKQEIAREAPASPMVVPAEMPR